MIENYALLKPYVWALTLLLTTTMIIYSCKKDRGSLTNQDSKEIIAEAKSYFENEILSQSLRLPNDPNFRHNVAKRPIWYKATIMKISLGDAVVVPIQFDQNVFNKPENSIHQNSLNKTSYLLIYNDKKNKKHAEWVTLFPLQDRLSKNDQFVGVVLVEEWDGGFKKAFSLNNLGKFEQMYLSSSMTKKISFNRQVTCINIPHYSFITVGGISTATYRGSETFCYGNDNGNVGDEGGNGSTYGYGHTGGEQQDEEVNPGDYLYFIDCNGDINGSAFIDINCGCLGGNTGKVSCPDPCIERAKISNTAQNQKISQQNISLRATISPNGNEWGVEHNLNSLTTNSDYKNISIREGVVGKFSPHFTWNSASGYTIGDAHTHVGSTAPSPSDIFDMAKNLTNNDVIASGPNGIDFYKKKCFCKCYNRRR